ncbi:BSP-domain-containing protein [Decorospora gaudefroyi]|uniref:BSP-domain-containing protein n=1 Tax=Decorospora gaudefroyi TaxID=184978 RepID=A0A6A5KPX7_9PLEO|nr:BSP-domain-containing protein [Decorospora gaudefroyi]
MSPQPPKQYQTMSPTTPPPAQSSALPPAHPFNTNPTSQAEPAPQPTHKITPQRKPLLRLELRDLSSAGSHAFLRLTHASHALEHAIDTVLQHLYTGLDASTCIPGTRSVTLVLRAMDGVAYTTGLALDDDHKEIHLNTTYLAHVPEPRQKEEILGVLVHEMVHCWQHSGCGSAPVGLTEGVADWVRLKAGLAPPHWKRRGDCEWDAGYERTGYFLEWLEGVCGGDVVRRINEGLRVGRYDGDGLWRTCCGKSVEELWEAYKKSLECV